MNTTCFDFRFAQKLNSHGRLIYSSYGHHQRAYYLVKQKAVAVIKRSIGWRWGEDWCEDDHGRRSRFIKESIKHHTPPRRIVCHDNNNYMAAKTTTTIYDEGRRLGKQVIIIVMSRNESIIGRDGQPASRGRMNEWDHDSIINSAIIKTKTLHWSPNLLFYFISIGKGSCTPLLLIRSVLSRNKELFDCCLPNFNFLHLTRCSQGELNLMGFNH